MTQFGKSASVGQQGSTERITAGPIDGGQRRYLTLLFADLSNSTELGGRLEAEHYAELLYALRQLCHEIIPRHGGLIARMQGDGVLALFGHPDAQEGDGRRATEAALDLHQAIGELDFACLREAGLGPLSLHSGIHAGLVYVVDGDVERGRFELLGNVPNVAARLADLARAGEIMVSEETLGPEARFFAHHGRQVLSVKGHAAPLAVLRVLGRAAAAPRAEAGLLRGQLPIVGRETERRQLSEALRQLLAGRSASLSISGGPGLGKTRLLEELAREAVAADCLLLRGYSESSLGAGPLQPFLQMLRGLQAAWAPSARHAALAEQAGPLIREIQAAAQNLVPSTPGAPGSAVALLRRLFASLAEAQPLLLILDDWQWADSLSQQVLDAVRLLERPILVLMSTRSVGSDSVETVGTTNLELAPLSAEESARAVRYLLPGAEPFIAGEIHRHAGGNPLFIEELCHAARADTARPHGDVGQDARHGGSAWLSALIVSRMARLPPPQADLIRAAAVIGTVFPAALLERITGRDAHDGLLRELARQDFIFPSDQPGMLCFKHGITREVIYGAVGLHERRALHRRIATALLSADAAREASLEPLAYHCSAGGMPAEAARHAEAAGDKALAVHALDRARAQLSAALAALDQLPLATPAQQLRWCTVAAKLGMACVFDPLALANGLAIFERGVLLARASGSEEALARAEYWLAYICYAKGLAPAAIAHCRSALVRAEALGDERLAAQVRATLGQALATAAEYDAALALLDTAVDSKRARARPGGSVAVGSAYALACKGGVLGDRGQFQAAEDCFAEALELLGGTVHQVASSVCNWVSAVYQWQGRWTEAAEMAERALAVAEHVKSRQLVAMGQALRGHARWMRSGDAADLQAVGEATAWIEARRGGLVTSLNYGWLVDGAIARQRPDEARRHAARLFLRARQHDRIGEAMGCRALALAAEQGGAPARADHYLAQARRSAAFRGSLHDAAKTLLCEATIAAARGEHAAALTRLDGACEQFERMGLRWDLAQAAALRARIS